MTYPNQQNNNPLAGALFGRLAGCTHPIAEFPQEIVTFTSPLGGPDWVLVLEVL